MTERMELDAPQEVDTLERQEEARLKQMKWRTNYEVCSILYHRVNELDC